MSDKLVEIERHNWPALRDLYAPHSPATFIGHNLVANFIRWAKQEPDIANIALYCLNGDWNDGTFAATCDDLLFIYTLAATSERLQKLLQLFDFSNGRKIHNVRSKDHSAVLDVIKSKGLRLRYNTEAFLHHVPAAVAMNYDTTPPTGITLKPIEHSDVHISDEAWLYRTENSLQHLQFLAKFNPSVGAYNSDGRMIAWIYYLPAGLLGVLQVDKEFFGKGLGALLSKALSRTMARMGHDIGSCVHGENVHSLNTFQKVGFNIIDKIYWIETYPAHSHH